jgi:hypothetical protein
MHIHVMSFNEFFAVMLFSLAGIGWLLKKLSTSNPAITDAAKKAATQKAIGMIAKWLK